MWRLVYAVLLVALSTVAGPTARGDLPSTTMTAWVFRASGLPACSKCHLLLSALRDLDGVADVHVIYGGGNATEAALWHDMLPRLSPRHIHVPLFDISSADVLAFYNTTPFLRAIEASVNINRAFHEPSIAIWFLHNHTPCLHCVALCLTPIMSCIAAQAFLG